MEKHEIDLGDEVKISVKYAGKEFSLREPTVEEIDRFRGSDTDKDAIATISQLLSNLGLPKEVVMKMGISKARRLIDGMMDLLTKKK